MEQSLNLLIKTRQENIKQFEIDNGITTSKNFEIDNGVTVKRIFNTEVE